MHYSALHPYYLHLIGIGRLMEWLRAARLMKMGATSNDTLITLDDTLSQRFSTGFPIRTEHQPHPSPFLAIQHHERHWFECIQWKTAFVKEDRRVLHLVASALLSPDESQRSIPSFCLGITTNDVSKLHQLFRYQRQPMLEGKHIWFDDVHEPHVSPVSLFRVPLMLLPADAPIPLDVFPRQLAVPTIQRLTHQHELKAAPSMTMQPAPRPRPKPTPSGVR